MSCQYTRGFGTDQLTAEVNVGTRGIAYSEMLLSQNDGPETKLAESDSTGSGDIAPVSLGSAAALANSAITVQTLISFADLSLSDDAVAQEIKNLVVRYTLSGGPAGTQVCDYEAEDVLPLPNSQVLVTKVITLV